MDIALYIATLLNQHNEVTIPGLGTFFQERVIGFYNSQTHLFNAPSQRLSFRRENKDDLILVNYCCAQRNISQNTAAYFIEKFVKSVWDDLNKLGHAYIKSLGRLTKQDDEYLFEANKNAIFTHVYYGLKPISEHITFISADKLPSNKGAGRAVPSHKGAKRTPAKTVQSDKQIQPTETTSKDDPSQKKPGKPITEAILAFLCLLFLATMGAYFFFPDRFNSAITLNPFDQKQSTVYPKKKSSITTDSITNAILLSDTLAIKDNTSIPTIDSSELTSDVNPMISNQVSYEIIGATFGKKSDADKYILHLKANGIAAKIADIPGPRSKISYGSFTDKKVAEAELRRVQKELNPDAWMAIIKPKKL